MNRADIEAVFPDLTAVGRDRVIVGLLFDLHDLMNLSLAMEETQMADLSALAAEVTENGDAVASAVSLLNTLAAELQAAATDPAAVQALADQLSSNSDALAAAVVANTPAAPPVDPPA